MAIRLCRFTGKYAFKTLTFFSMLVGACSSLQADTLPSGCTIAAGWYSMREGSIFEGTDLQVVCSGGKKFYIPSCDTAIFGLNQQKNPKPNLDVLIHSGKMKLYTSFSEADSVSKLYYTQQQSVQIAASNAKAAANENKSQCNWTTLSGDTSGSTARVEYYSLAEPSPPANATADQISVFAQMKSQYDAAGCAAKVANVPVTGFCGGVVSCGGVTETALCEASGVGACPSATDCYRKAFPQGAVGLNQTPTLVRLSRQDNNNIAGAGNTADTDTYFDYQAFDQKVKVTPPRNQSGPVIAAGLKFLNGTGVIWGASQGSLGGIGCLMVNSSNGGFPAAGDCANDPCVNGMSAATENPIQAQAALLEVILSMHYPHIRVLNRWEIFEYAKRDCSFGPGDGDLFQFGGRRHLCIYRD